MDLTLQVLNMSYWAQSHFKSFEESYNFLIFTAFAWMTIPHGATLRWDQVPSRKLSNWISILYYLQNDKIQTFCRGLRKWTASNHVATSPIDHFALLSFYILTKLGWFYMVILENGVCDNYAKKTCLIEPILQKWQRLRWIYLKFCISSTIQ